MYNITEIKNTWFVQLFLVILQENHAIQTSV